MPSSSIMSPTDKRLLVKRKIGGIVKSITKSIPKPIVIIDSREQNPFLFNNHSNWIEGTVIEKLDVGDYSIKGMEDIVRLERKTLTDVITTLMQCRKGFINNCKRISNYKYSAIILEASYKDVKSEYNGLYTFAHPNAISGSLDAIEANYRIPIIYTSNNRKLAEEKAASWLSKCFTYWYLENNGLGRFLIPGDL